MTIVTFRIDKWQQFKLRSRAEDLLTAGHDEASAATSWLHSEWAPHLLRNTLVRGGRATSGGGLSAYADDAGRPHEASATVFDVQSVFIPQTGLCIKFLHTPQLHPRPSFRARFFCSQTTPMSVHRQWYLDRVEQWS